MFKHKYKKTLKELVDVHIRFYKLTMYYNIYSELESYEIPSTKELAMLNMRDFTEEEHVLGAKLMAAQICNYLFLNPYYAQFQQEIDTYSEIFFKKDNLSQMVVVYTLMMMMYLKKEIYGEKYIETDEAKRINIILNKFASYDERNNFSIGIYSKYAALYMDLHKLDYKKIS